MIPPNITIGNLSLNPLTVFYILGVVLWLFIIWYEGQKDGFDSDRIFDISFWAISLGFCAFLLTKSYTTRLEIFDPANWVLNYDKRLIMALAAFVSSLLPVMFFSRIWKWSVYRLLDLYTSAYIGFLIIVTLGHFIILGNNLLLLPLVLLVILQSILLRYRGYKLLSGLIFSAVLLLISLTMIAFFRVKGYLLFSTLLITMSLTNLYFRKKISMIMDRNLPSEMIKTLRNKLFAKDKKLKNEQQMLISQDSFKNTDRTMDNAEELDEAILEDNQKELTDIKMTAIRAMRIQVRKALGFMRLGRYGICEVCGNPIDKARLRAYPEATKCIDCANKEKQ